MRKLFLVALLAQGCGSFNSTGTPSDMTFQSPDMVDAMPPPIQLCTIFAGEGKTFPACPAGQHCTAGLYNGIRADLCIPDPTQPIPENGKCTAIVFEGGLTVGDLCKPGLVCANAAGVGRCRKPCFLHKDCTATQACSGSTTSPTEIQDPQFADNMLALNGCVEDEHCDPVTQTNCFDPGGSRWVISARDEKARVTVCGFPGATGVQPPGTPCNSSGDCRPGVRCSGLGFCQLLCYQDAPPTATVGKCPAGTGICSPIFGAGTHYGECD